MNETETNKISKVQIEEQPNITFGIDRKIVSSIFGFLTGVNCDIPMRFFKDRIFIHLKSPDNIQYAQVEINSSDLLDYNPRLGSIEKTEKVIVIDTRRINIEKIDEIINIIKPFEDEFGFAGEESLTKDFDKYKYRYMVRIKVFDEKIEFHLPGNVIIWAKLIKNAKEIENIMKPVDRLPDIIKKVRSDPNIKKASVTIEQHWFDAICSIPEHMGKLDKLFKYESASKLNISKKEGFTLISRSRNGFYELKLKPRYIHIEHNGDEETHMYVDKELITPIRGLVKFVPILIEIRTNKPIIFEQKLTNGINAMLTVAPRIPEELEDEKEMKDEQEKKMPGTMDF